MHRPDILIITTAHQAWDTRITYRQAQSLSKCYKVHLLARPTPIRLPDSIIHHALIWSDSLPLRVISAFFQSFWLVFCYRIRSVHIHDPELIPFILIFHSFGIKCITDHHEDYHALLKRKELSVRQAKFFKLILGLNDAIVFHNSDLAIAATEVIAAKTNVDKNKKLHFPNFAGKLDLGEIDAPTELSDCDIDLIMTGFGSELRGLLAILDILQGFDNQGFNIPVFHYAGVIRPEIELIKAQNHPAWKYVVYHGFCDRSTLAALLKRSKIGLCPYLPDDLHNQAMPNKIFEYAYIGCAVVAQSFDHWSFIEHYQIGQIADFRKVSESSSILRSLLNDEQRLAVYRDNAFKISIEHFLYTDIESSLLQSYNNLLTL